MKHFKSLQDYYDYKSFIDGIKWAIGFYLFYFGMVFLAVGISILFK